MLHGREGTLGRKAFINSLLFINTVNAFQSEPLACPRAELEGRGVNSPIVS